MQRIAIWGAGEIGKQVYLKCRDSYLVSRFYDSDQNKQNMIIGGVKVEKFEKKKELIIVASSYW